MGEIEEGKSCGACHGKVAFTPEACSRCHPAFEPAEFTPTLDTGIVLARVADAAGPGPNPPSRFAHDVHRIRYRCSACHPGLFAMRAGADTLDMASMRAGASCGACHDGRAAFGIADCGRCHVAGTAPPP
jgi:c(7)-type cytochrome triheme protein